MASFTLQQDEPKELTQDQVVIECLSRYIAAADRALVELSETPSIRRADEILRASMEMGRARGEAELAGYIWPE